MRGIEKQYFELLEIWCRRLICLQAGRTAMREFRGGILCPACRMIHGRVADAVYPMVFLYDRTRQNEYLDAAELLFEWSENMLADDGSYYNDAQNDWNGITVFFVSMLSRTLLYHGSCLPGRLKKRFEERLEKNAEWICRTIGNGFDANINYQAAAAEAMALYGTYTGKTRYLIYAAERARFCMGFISEEGFLTGESHPRDYRSPRGVRGVDIGYNLEESLPALLECAEILKDRDMEGRVLDSLAVHCRFLLPDGGMDNSFGSRNYKWTYWGSRTSDGYLAMMERAGRRREEFLKYKYAVWELLSQCTADGLLYGGPDYREHGELPCVHHTFCKAKAVAQLLDTGVEETGLRCGFSGRTEAFWYPELLTGQYFCGGFYASVTVNDVLYQRGGHISGGTVGMLWHEKTGPLLAASVMEYSLYEVTNSQLSLKKEDQGKMSLRFERTEGGIQYSSDQDTEAGMSGRVEEERIRVDTEGILSTLDHRPGGRFRFSYCLENRSFEALCESEADGALYVPVIGRKIREGRDGIYILTSRTGIQVGVVPIGHVEGIRRRFHLCGGFLAWELEIRPERGKAGVRLEVRDEK